MRLPAVLFCVTVVACAPVRTADPRPETTPAPAVLRASGVPAGAQRVEVRWVSDGDTLTVRAVRRGVLARGVDEPVRLLEVDTPESKDPDLPVQCFAVRATRALERLVPPGSTAWVVPDTDLRDRYDRALLYLWNADGVFVNERLVRRGFARAVLYPPNDRHIALIREAEADARKHRRGLWGSCA